MTSEEDRLVKIESDLAHLENLTETLNETIIAHEKTLRQQQQQIEGEKAAGKGGAGRILDHDAQQPVRDGKPACCASKLNAD